MAMWVMAVVAVAPFQCFSPGGNQTTSPGRISSMPPPSHCTQPTPAVTIKVWPRGCVCQAVLAPGSKVTAAPPTRAGAGAVKSGSMRTVPVNQSAGPLPDGFDPACVISILVMSLSAVKPISRLERPAAVNRDRRARDERAKVGTHPQNGLRNLLRLAQPADRLQVDRLLDVTAGEAVHHRGFDVAGKNCVHANVRLRVIERGGFGHADYGVLGSSIGAAPRDAADART